jgi:hypothetical protein
MLFDNTVKCAFIVHKCFAHTIPGLINDIFNISYAYKISYKQWMEQKTCGPLTGRSYENPQTILFILGDKSLKFTISQKEWTVYILFCNFVSDKTKH